MGLLGFTPPTNRPVTPPTLPWQALVAILFASVLLHQGKALGQQPSSAPSEMHVVSDVQGGETSESEEFDWNDLDELLNLSVVNPA